jgi:hypothetical protein
MSGTFNELRRGIAKEQFGCQFRRLSPDQRKQVKDLARRTVVERDLAIRSVKDGDRKK